MTAIASTAVNMQTPLVLENQGHSFLFGKQTGTIKQLAFIFFLKTKKGKFYAS